MAGLVQLLDEENMTITGTFKETLEKLSALVTPDRNDYSFPTSHTFRKHLERLRPNLAEIGITFEFGRHTNKGQTVELTRRPPPPSWAASAAQDLADDLVFDEGELNHET